jgi:Arc/MetJ family transcription regulator
MRTTVDLDDELLARIRMRALAAGHTLRDEVNDLLRQALARKRKTDYRFEWKTFRGRLQPGVDLDDRDSLFDRMEGR